MSNKTFGTVKVTVARVANGQIKTKPGMDGRISITTTGVEADGLMTDQGFEVTTDAFKSKTTTVRLVASDLARISAWLNSNKLNACTVTAHVVAPATIAELTLRDGTETLGILVNAVLPEISDTDETDPAIEAAALSGKKFDNAEAMLQALKASSIRDSSSRQAYRAEQLKARTANEAIKPDAVPSAAKEALRFLQSSGLRALSPWI